MVPEQAATTEETEIDVLLGFLEKHEGEILFLDADNISTDATYPGMYFYMSSGALAYHLVPKHGFVAHNLINSRATLT